MAVKSALRVLQVLDYFDDVQSALTAAEMAGALGWPRSSTWGILRTLAESGYLVYDAQARTYMPSERVSVLGLWAYTPLFREGRLLQLMHALRQQTQGRVVLAAQTGNLVRYIHTVQSGRAGNWHFRRGAPVQMLRTSVGRLFLSLYSDAEATRIIRHLGARSQGDAEEVDAILAELADIRRRGYSVSINRMATGHGAISMLLPRIHDQVRPLAIGMMFPREMIEKRRNEFAQSMRAAIKRHFSDLLD